MCIHVYTCVVCAYSLFSVCIYVCTNVMCVYVVCVYIVCVHVWMCEVYSCGMFSVCIYVWMYVVCICDIYTCVYLYDAWMWHVLSVWYVYIHVVCEHMWCVCMCLMMKILKPRLTWALNELFINLVSLATSFMSYWQISRSVELDKLAWLITLNPEDKVDPF